MFLYKLPASRKRQQSSQVPSEGAQKAQGHHSLSSFLSAFLLFLLYYFALKLAFLSTEHFFLLLFSCSFFSTFISSATNILFRFVLRSFCLKTSHFISNFCLLFIFLSVTYNYSVIVLPPQTLDGYNSVLCVFSISPRVAIFFPHRLSTMSCSLAVPLTSIILHPEGFSEVP